MTLDLYGTPNSLYTAKVRSYLTKQGIGFRNRAAGEARFREVILPRIHRWIVPVVECADGAILQDGADIIAHFEAAGAGRHPAYPPTPRQALVSRIFELFGGEGLLRPAMHYRWNFDAVNRPFLEADFAAALAPTGAPAEVRASIFAMASTRMRGAMASFGVSEATIPAVEAAYAEFLALFDAHLATAPYLLGGHPTIGDYGLIAPLYAHLGRDPAPARLMQATAHRVWRWTERMNRADADCGEYGEVAETLFADDSVPDTLRALLRFVASDYLPEIRAHVAFANQWLAARPEIAAGSNGLPRRQDRIIGTTSFDWRGHRVEVAVMPYRLYLLQKVQDLVETAEPPSRAAMLALLDDVGLAELPGLRTVRRVERRDYLEVWGA